ncbi:MAG: putative toxin-antitoxin system toxin component, PIN family [Oscillospiraceae bacterium]|jgi:putative PIN family toxin of toxin-antitoxin system|nr:putative toxin-antitoxin system toxin component, PIN family [Oscillospiraceae bacterium]
MSSKRIKIILDTNIWVSFVIGKRLNEVERVLKSSYIEVFVCEKLIREVNDTLLKPKLRKYVSAERKYVLLNYMAACSLALVYEQTVRSRDVDDDYLLDLAQLVDADYLITGDNDLLILQQHYQTKILNFNNFISIFSR